MRKLISLVAALSVALGLVAATPEPVSASCSQAKVFVFEDSNGFGDGLQICYGTNVNNLATLTHVPAGNCNGNSDNTWNNCISSIVFYETSVNTSVCLYTEVGYIGLITKLTTNGQAVNGWPNPPFGLNDTASSIRFGC